MHALLARLLKGRDGLRVIADVHGHPERLAEMADGARAKNYALLSLGDLIDRGPDSVATMALAAELVAEGLLLVIPGNHDAKHLRWYRGNPVRLSSDGLGKTVEEIQARPDGSLISRRFAEMIASMPVWMVAGPYLFAHGGFAPDMLYVEPPLMGKAKARERSVSLALYGETDGTFQPEGFPTRTYTWLDTIPAGVTVVIGHDIVSMDAPVTREGKLGGRVIHLDTGSGCGGKLSCLDIPVAELGKIPEAATPPAEPLLTVMVGPSGAGKSSWVKANFPAEAIVSTDAIRQELFGDFRVQSHQDRVHATVSKRAHARLSQGLPVVIDATHIRKRDRLMTVRLVPANHPVRYVIIDRPLAEKMRDGGWRLDEGDLVERHDQIFRSQLADILKGDGLPNIVVDDRRAQLAGKQAA